MNSQHRRGLLPLAIVKRAGTAVSSGWPEASWVWGHISWPARGFQSFCRWLGSRAGSGAAAGGRRIAPQCISPAGCWSPFPRPRRGRAPEYLRLNAKVVDLVKYFVE